ncbi:MAG TPA: hypothetical protein VML96_02070 [Egibacteraceae bacterium]|nr:hypothetical protein [Egibacteraceae bacterium]
MASSAAESAIRNYLVSLKDPSTLRDDKKIADLEQRLSKATDEVERVRLRQQVMDAQNPPANRFEDDFITHAKAWADEQGISLRAFAEEGVPDAVLRRAGFRAAAARGRRRVQRTRTRVSSEQVRAAIPKGTFTLRDVQERSGASYAVVRKVVSEEVAAGRVSDEGTAADHTGPGRSPTLYKR